MEGWERDMLDSVNELKQWEQASRPPPVLPKKYEYRANFRGIVTLATTAQAQELANLIQAFTSQSVDIFHSSDTDPNAAGTLLRNLNRMVDLLDTFPGITLDDYDRDAANKNLTVMRDAQRSVNTLLSGNVTRARLTGDDGRKLAGELKVILERMMNIARIMENFQRKLLVLATQKASQITAVMRNANVANRLEEKIDLFHKHLDNLANLTTQRMNMLDSVRDGAPFKNKLWMALEEIKKERPVLEQHTTQACRHQDTRAVPQQAKAAETIIRCVSEIADVAEQSAQKAHGNFDHTITIQQQLDLLTDAVKNRSGPEAANAARTIANELEKMQSALPVKGVVDPADPRAGDARQGLQDAFDRMQKLLRDLAAASTRAINTPEEPNVFDDLVREMKDETLQLETKTYDSISTQLASSGMIEAAAQAAQQLAALFK